jgi:3-phosphoshikimate 1-carboxyvinyltransferase
MPNEPLPIQPIPHPLQASVRVPGSKSLTNRALLIAALADGDTCLSNALFSDDSRYFAAALQALGFEVFIEETQGEMSVKGLSGRIPASQAQLFIGNAGTAARFLSAFLTLGQGEYILDGEPRMRERPIGDLVSALGQLGAKLDTGANQCPPVKIQANGLPGGKTSIAGDISSQFLSGLLMVAPYARSPVEIDLSTELNSKPYVDMTLAVMQEFGVMVERTGYERFYVQPGCYQANPSYAIESDASAASYFFAAPAICGGSVTVENMRRDSLQGDVRFLDALARMGCQVSEQANSIRVSRTDELRGIDVDMRDISDTAQTLSAVAPFAATPTRIRGIASSRHKETDRVNATCTELARLGVRVEQHLDGMTIYPCAAFQPAMVETYNDHRMAMAFALVGLKASGVAIQNPSCVSKTFPHFFATLEKLR